MGKNVKPVSKVFLLLMANAHARKVRIMTANPVSLVQEVVLTVQMLRLVMLVILNIIIF